MHGRSSTSVRRCGPALAGLVLLAGAQAVIGQGPPGGAPPLPPVPAPAGNPVTAEKAVLGKILFWDEQLSSDNTVACGTCHRPGAGGSDPRLGVHPGLDGVSPSPDDTFGSPGVIRTDPGGRYAPDAVFRLRPQVTGRHAPEIGGAVYQSAIFWDGRAGPAFSDPETGQLVLASGAALESQAVGPPVSDVEMAHEARDWAAIVAKLETVRPLDLATDLPPGVAAAIQVDGTYPGLFGRAFGTPVITAARIAMAIATYERTLVPDQTPWDLFNAGNPAALTPNQQQGLQVFRGPGRCDLCHTPPFFSDGDFHNLGLRPIAADPGRGAVTGVPSDGGRFKTASLRNVGLRARTMHTGSFSSLDAVVAFYANGGGQANNQTDPLLVPLSLTPPQRNALVDFLRNGLTDPRAAAALPPFDRPTLWSERNPPGSNLYGAGGGPPFVPVPRMLAGIPENRSHAGFRLGLARGPAGSPAWLAIGSRPQVPAVLAGGVPVLIDVSATPNVVPVVLDGSGPAGGHATVMIPIPDDPAVIGLEAFAQWLVLGPNGPATSRGAAFTVF